MSVLAPTAGGSRPFNFPLGFGLPALLMAALLIGEPSQLDFALSRLFYEPGAGFVGRHSWLLEDFLHDRVKQLVILIGVLAIAGFLLSLLPTRLARWRRPLGYLVLALGLSTSIVSPLKTLTGVHCPWSLSEFGGTETFTPLLADRAPTLKPGRCWPGGHASAGFSLLALYFVLRDRRPRLAHIALGVALALGTLMSAGRVMQGAHFASHNLWTLLFDWTICLACYRLLLYRRAATPAPGIVVTAAT
ncbi:phosphatase PAP2 family protein [Pseudomonas stutzeri]|jgi:membrane-associated PAP2 superfamily phosphatase|uniref:phosphatase PAP2 family protein n=1 Tax=Pseudomonas sp. FIP_A4 TaxID=3070684 RepID=UPI0006B9DA93|nr:phosphatase PAP2 family protein [Stutzerimonas degradans]MDT3708615.1 phosphatase PAP2 family protein [Pseudomonadaceae bacterium]